MQQENTGRIRQISANFYLYSGMHVNMLGQQTLQKFAGQMSEVFGRHKHHMRQSSPQEILTGLQAGDYVISVKSEAKDDLVLWASAHVRDAVREPRARELGGLFSLGMGQGTLVAKEGVWLALQKENARAVEALVATTNLPALHLFETKLQAIKKDERPSDYVKKPGSDEGIPMIVFDITHVLPTD